MQRSHREAYAHISKMSVFEKHFRSKGYVRIAGADEAGRGPLAGPVVAAVCLLPPNFRIWNIDDSKVLKEVMREKIYKKLIQHPKVVFGVGIVDSKEIDKRNILQASLFAMQKALETLPIRPDFLLVDGNRLPNIKIPGQAIIQGDSLSISIASASIIAKCTRDRIMKDAHIAYPEYFFQEHKGYATKKHLQMLRLYGPSPIHRFSYEPVRAALENQDLSSYEVKEERLC